MTEYAAGDRVIFIDSEDEDSFPREGTVAEFFAPSPKFAADSAGEYSVKLDDGPEAIAWAHELAAA